MNIFHYFSILYICDEKNNDAAPYLEYKNL